MQLKGGDSQSPTDFPTVQYSMQMQGKLNAHVARLAGLETEYVDAHGRHWVLVWRSGEERYVD